MRERVRQEWVDDAEEDLLNMRVRGWRVFTDRWGEWRNIVKRGS